MRTLIPTVLLSFLAACSAAPQPAAQDPAAAAAQEAPAAGPAAKDPKAAAAERSKLEKELRGKQRELSYCADEERAAALGRQVAGAAAEQAVAAAERALEKARRELDVFRVELRPRELEEKRIGLDVQRQRAKESADELKELQAMYENDEFASTTKELVIERGRSQLEFAQRRLRVEEQELAHFEGHTLQVRERDLVEAVAEAERALQKSQVELVKSQIERDVQVRKEADKKQDLQEEIAELEKKLEEAR